MTTQGPTEVPRQSLIRHRQQRWLQIYLPLILAAVVLIIVPALGLILNPSPLGVATGHWAAIAVIWLAAPLLVLSLLGVTAIGALIYLLKRLTETVPRLSWRILTAIMHLQSNVRHWSDRSAQPFISIQSLIAGLRRGRALLLGRKNVEN